MHECYMNMNVKGQETGISLTYVTDKKQFDLKKLCFKGKNCTK